MNTETINAEPLLIFFDSEKYDSEISTITNAAEDLKKAVSKFNAFRLGDLKQSELIRLVTEPESLVISRLSAKITEDDLTLPNGLKMSREAYLANIETPIGLVALLDFIDHLNRRVERNMSGIPLKADTKKEYIKHFILGEDCILIAVDSVLNNTLKRNQVHVYSELSKKLFRFAEKLLEQIKESDLSAFIQENEKRAFDQNLKGILSSLVIFEQSGPMINWEFIKRFERL